MTTAAQHYEYKRLIDRTDPTSCEACGDIEAEHCLYHQGVIDGYAAAEQILEGAKR